jgi:hypothetical protein
MGTAAATTELYHEQDLSERKLRALIEEQNRVVKNARTLMGTLDGEAALTIDNDYAAQLTAKEVDFEGYTPSGSATVGKPDAGYLGEALAKSLLEQHNAAAQDIRAIVAKLNLDDGIAAADYASVAEKITVLGITAAAGEIVDIEPLAGGGLDGETLQHVSEQQAALIQDWHNAAAKLDVDANTTGAYESAITAKTLTEV